MSFLRSSEWQVLASVAGAVCVLLVLREIFRFRLLVGRHGKLTTYVACALVVVFFALLLAMVATVGFLAAVLTFAALFLLSSLVVGAHQARLHAQVSHPDNIARHEFYVGLIDKITSREDVRELLAAYSRTPEFLRKALRQQAGMGNVDGIGRAVRIDTVRGLLEIYSREEWSEEDKALAACKYLQHGHRYLRRRLP